MRTCTRLGAFLALASLAACGGGGSAPSPSAGQPPAAAPMGSGRMTSRGRRAVPPPPVVEQVLLDDGFGGLWVNQFMDLGAYAGSVALGLQENTSGANWAIGSFPKWIVTQGCVAIQDRLNVQFGDPTPKDWCVNISGSYQQSVPAGLPRTGTLELRDALQLLPGTYRFTFELGPPENPGVLGADRCVVSLDSHYRETFTMAYTDPWKTITRNIRICEPSTTKIRFSQTGPRNLHQPNPLLTQYFVNWGCRIDNVKFERLAPALAIDAIEPAYGGNVGTVHATIRGGGFPDGAVAAVLRGAGGPDISAHASSTACGASVAAAFDLRGAPPGMRDVVLTFTNGQSVTLPAGFAVEQGGGPDLWVAITDPGTVRAGRLARFGVLVTNRGNVDSDPDTVLLIRPPAGATDGLVQTEGESIALTVGAAPAKVSGQVQSRTASEALTGSATGAFTVFSLSPGATQALAVEVRPPASGNVAVDLYRPVPSTPRATADMWRRFYDRKAEELVDESALRVGQLAEEIISAVWLDTLDQFTEVAMEQRRAGGAAMQSAGQGFMQWPASPTGVSTALCLEGFLHFRSCYSASELAAWTAVCVLERLREAFIENPSEPVHSELGEAIAHYDRVNRKLMEHRPEMASMSVENWLADSLLRNVQKAVQRITVVQSGDPNEKTGCAGFGPSHAVSNGQMLHYRIDFENVPTATAPAATVEVTDLLDTALLDPATVQLLHVGFGSYDANPLQVAGQFNATIDLRPAQDLLVSVEGACDVATGRLHWKFTTLDPATGREPTNALLGFLPPNQMAPQGQGYVTFSVMPRASVGTSTTIRNKAAIVFDFNPAIETAEWSNIVDAEVPRSAAAASTPQPGLAEIPVSWSGTDDSSGVLDYRVYVSEDGDPYTLWQDGVAETSAIFQGAPGHSYRFYSVARDQTGNVESKSTFDAEVVLPSAPAEEGGGGSVGWEAVVLVIAAVGRGLSLARRRGPRGRAV